MPIGRPRKYPAGTNLKAVERERVRAAGGETISILIGPEASKALRAIMARTGESKRAVLERLLVAEATT